MDKGKSIMGSGRQWAVDFSDNSTSLSSRGILDPAGFSRAAQYHDDSTLSRQKKDAESSWKAQFFEPFKDKNVDHLLPKLVYIALNLVGLGMGVWKFIYSCFRLGFLFTARSVSGG